MHKYFHKSKRQTNKLKTQSVNRFLVLIIYSLTRKHFPEWNVQIHGFQKSQGAISNFHFFLRKPTEHNWRILHCAYKRAIFWVYDYGKSNHSFNYHRTFWFRSKLYPLRYETRTKIWTHSSDKVWLYLTPRCIEKIGIFLWLCNVSASFDPQDLDSGPFTVTTIRWHVVKAFQCAYVTSAPCQVWNQSILWQSIS